MSARVSVSGPATHSTAVTGTSAGTAARASNLPDNAGPIGAADGNDSGGDDAATGTGARAGQPFADALASATRAGAPKSATDTNRMKAHRRPK